MLGGGRNFRPTTEASKRYAGEGESIVLRADDIEPAWRSAVAGGRLSLQRVLAETDREWRRRIEARTADWSPEELRTFATLIDRYMSVDLPGELHDNHASYVDHWLKILKGDSSAIIKAAAKAEQAVTWLHNAAAGGAPGIDQPEALAA